MSDHVGTCPDCGCGLIRQRAWMKATTEQRREWLANDQRLVQGHGLCRGCYLRAYKDGAFPKRKPSSGKRPATHPCPRCGITTTAALCLDCSETLTRDEEALWSA